MITHSLQDAYTSYDASAKLSSVLPLKQADFPMWVLYQGTITRDIRPKLCFSDDDFLQNYRECARFQAYLGTDLLKVFPQEITWEEVPMRFNIRHVVIGEDLGWQARYLCPPSQKPPVSIVVNHVNFPDALAYLIAAISEQGQLGQLNI